MRKLVDENTPLSANINLDIELEPMSFFNIIVVYSGTQYSMQDKVRAYGALGGIPRYHALFNTDKSVEENIQETILSPQGCLHNEPESMLLSNGVRDPAIYNAVLGAIADGCTRSSAIAERVGITSNKLSFYIESLAEMGWVSKEHPFDSASDRLAIYRIDDVFVRFWYSFVAGLRSELEFGEPQEIYDSRIAPRMEDYMRRVFVDIGHSYLQLTNATDLLHQSVLRSGRWWNQDGSEEIDMVAELADGSHLIGECVWTSSPIGVDVYHKLKEKASRLLGVKYVENASYLIICSAGRDDELKQVAGTNGLYVVG